MKNISTLFKGFTILLVGGITFAGYAHMNNSNYNTVLKAHSTLAITDCFRPNATITTNTTTCLSTMNVTSATACPGHGSNIWQGRAVFTLNTANPIPAVDLPDLCPGGEIVCCFQVQQDMQPCTVAQGQNRYNIGIGSRPYEVSTVYCDENQ